MNKQQTPVFWDLTTLQRKKMTVNTQLPESSHQQHCTQHTPKNLTAVSANDIETKITVLYTLE